MATFSAMGFGGWDPLGSFAEGSLSNWFGNENADRAQERSKDMAVFDFVLQQQALRTSPSAMREGLESAGYNPILAVNSATNVPTPSMPAGPQASNSSGNSSGKFSLDALQQLASIKQTNAQADYIGKKTENEGWKVLTLNTTQAAGLGATLCHKLGINLHESGNRQWVIAYNTVTGEFRNLANASVFGVNSTGEVTNAKDVPEATVHGVLESGGKVHDMGTVDYPREPRVMFR